MYNGIIFVEKFASALSKPLRILRSEIFTYQFTHTVSEGIQVVYLQLPSVRCKNYRSKSAESIRAIIGMNETIPISYNQSIVIDFETVVKFFGIINCNVM